MKTIIRSFLKEWLIPPNILRILQKIMFEKSIRSQYGLSKKDTNEILSRNAKFHNMYAGKRCFVICNGPSLNNSDLSGLGSEITIVMNLFFRHPILNVWQPTFYCAAEPPTGGYKNKSTIPIIKEGISKLFPQAFFIPLITKKLSDQYCIHPPDKTYYLEMLGEMKPNKTLNLTKTIPSAPDTSVMAVMLALALGCSPIYLIGIDYDWLSHRSLHRHFYDENDQVEIREDLGKTSYSEMIELSIRCWRTHESIRKYAVLQGQQIFNATKDSFLDVYPYARFDDVLMQS